MPQTKLEKLLLHSKLINPAELADMAASAAQQDRRLAWMLLDEGAIDERAFAELLAKETKTELLDPLPPDVPPWVYRRLPAPIARQYKTVPVDLTDSQLKVAMIDPTDSDTIDVLTAATSGFTILPVVAVKSALERLLEHVYPFDVDVDATRLSSRDFGTEPGMDTARVSVVRAQTPDVKEEGSVPDPGTGHPDAAQQIHLLETRLNTISAMLHEAQEALAQLRRSLGAK
jgi:type IV pilus assembly protein PilB